MLAADTEDIGPGNPVNLDEEQQAAVIADVATDPDPSGTGASKPVVLEVGVGRINEIHVVAPMVDANGIVYLQVVKGGVFSYYEFPWPAEDRLTDEKWKQMLADNQAPPLQDWTSSFIVKEGEYADLGRAVSYHQNSITYMFWDPQNAVYNFTQLLEPFRAEIEALNAAKQYIGHQLVSSDFRSFDLQSPTLAVVTVRETWSDKKYNYSGDYPIYDETPFAERGPYTLDVTYTLESVQNEFGSNWQVTGAVYTTQPPAW
jgi:hypothetical protein